MKWKLNAHKYFKNFALKNLLKIYKIHNIHMNFNEISNHIVGNWKIDKFLRGNFEFKNRYIAQEKKDRYILTLNL